ncbi:polysaccharide biosynthesis tyrosine autokinase [Actinoplanes sp. NBC_00393]|uniref:polysaccharide biosynthesis tyrosine autokinase n=1 Tax=Actinoplanes sp. NBC_00393 TaxID=2975953 RepID=UPI002E20FFD5
MLRMLRMRWALVVSLTIAGLAVSGSVVYFQTPLYAAETQLFVSTTAAPVSYGDLSQGSAFTQQRVRSYVDIVTSPLVTQKVIQGLRLPDTPQSFAKRVEATSPLDSVLIDIVVTDSSPDRAQEIAREIAAHFSALVNQIETPRGARVSPVKISVTKPAVVSPEPVSPRVAVTLAAGLLGGLLLGTAAAFLRHILDKAVRDSDHLAVLTSAPVLTTVPFESTSAKSPLIAEDSTYSARAEALRRLRTNLQFVSVDQPFRSLVVTSALPGEGKSTTTCNLAIILAEAGYRVLIVDADLRRPTIARYLDLEGAVGLANVLAGQASLDDAMQPWGPTGLQVLPSGYIPPNPSELLASRNMSDLLEELTSAFDMVLVDTPPLLAVTDGAVVAAMSDGCVLVSRHGSTTTTEAQAAAAALRAAGASLHGCILNMTPHRSTGSYAYYGTDRNKPAKEAPDSPSAQPLVPLQPPTSRRFVPEPTGAVTAHDGSAE